MTRVGVSFFGLILVIAIVIGPARASSTIAEVTITPDLRRVIVKFDGRTVGNDGFSVKSKPHSLDIDVSATRLGQGAHTTRAGRGTGLEVRVSPVGSGARFTLDFGKSPVPNYRVRWLGSYLTVFLGNWSPDIQAQPSLPEEKKPHEAVKRPDSKPTVSRGVDVARQRDQKARPPVTRSKEARRTPTVPAPRKEPPPAAVATRPKVRVLSEPKKPLKPVTSSNPESEINRPVSVPYPVHATAIPDSPPPAIVKEAKEDPLPPAPEKPIKVVTTHSNRMSVTASENEREGPPRRSQEPEPRRGPLMPTYCVFVYGSDMNHPAFMDWLEANDYDSSSIISASPAVLNDYDFVWNYYSRDRTGGAVNVEPHPNSRVFGLLIEFDESLLPAFDRKAGHPAFYSRNDRRVAVRRLDDGTTTFAWLYSAKPNRGGRRDVWPTAEYKQSLMEAARFWELPGEHLDKMSKWRTQ